MQPINLPTVHDPAELFRLNSDGGVVLWHDGSAPELIRERIEAVKQHLLAAVEHHVDMPPEHLMVDGMYLRKITIPKGTVVVGKIHLKHCLNIVAKGDISVLTEIGCGRFTAGATAISGPGTQKLGYAHEDTVFINVFRTDQTAIEDIEAEIAGDKFTYGLDMAMEALPCL